MKEFVNKRNIINLLLLGIMVLAIPLTVKLARQQQILFSRAAAAQIVFLTKDQNGTTTADGQSCVTTRDNKKVTLCKEIKVRLVAPTGADIKFQQAQSRTSILPQQGLINTVYAQATCNEGGETYNKGDYFRRCKNGTHCIYDLFQCGADDWEYQGEEEDCNRCSDTSDATPAPTTTSTPEPDDTSSPTSTPEPGGTTATPEPGGGSTNPGDSCPGYHQPDEGGTTRYCHPGKILDNGSCGYNDDPDNTTCDIVSCPAGQTLEGNECKATSVISSGTPANTCKSDPVTPPTGYKWTADCSQSCNINDDCSKGVNNQDGWCYGFTEGNRCLKLESAGQGSPAEGTCRNDPVTPPAGYKWTADCGKSCSQNSDCPKGTNNQDGWCYGFANNTNRCLKLESVPSGGEKCFACDIAADGKSRYRYAGSSTGDVSKCPTNAPVCDPKTSVTCKGPDNLKEDLCNTAAALTITKYRFAENPSELASAPVNNYQQGGVTITHTFSDTPGEKSIWYQFGDDAGNWTEQNRGGIILVGPDPVISGASCNLDITDNSLKFQVIGDNFGARDQSSSRLAADNSNLEIREWANQKVVARMTNPPDTTTGKTYTVTLTRSDGTKDTASCSINTTQISLGAKLFCRSPSNFDQDNVKLTIVQNALGVGVTAASGNFQAGSKARETVTITKEGVISNLKTKLQQDIEYIVCIKAPKSLRQCSKPFPAMASGNNIITHKFDLPVGDVNDDEVINSADASICKAEWGPARAGRAKACEFNRDNVTNSFEWSCLLHDFNAPNQSEP